MKRPATIAGGGLKLRETLLLKNHAESADVRTQFLARKCSTKILGDTGDECGTEQRWIMKKAGTALELNELAADATQNSPLAKTLPELNPFRKRRGENAIRRKSSMRGLAREGESPKRKPGH